jgi:biopolymer transport protein ExbD
MAFIPSHKKRHKTSNGEVRLQLTSMMDMFTIILVFLLKTYSTHGQLINPSDDLTLPTSTIQQVPEVGLDVTVSSGWTLVNGIPVIRTEDIEKQPGYLIPELQQEMMRYSSEAMRMQEQYGAEFSGKATIQGDRNLPYKLLIKVMYTCGQSNYPNMRLVVYTEK